MYQTIKQRLTNSFLCLSRVLASPDTEVEWQRRLGKYVSTFPTSQNALDIFQGEWASMMPSDTELGAGMIPLFEDRKIVWAEQLLGGFTGCKILELGPLEGGHTYMLEQRGAASILAIEANQRAYLKCLVTKEILNLTRSRFLLGNFMIYLNHTQESFDIGIASGVLYHMKNPARLIHLLAERTKKVMIWTHYYDQALLKNHPHIFQPIESDYQGFKHVLYQQRYRQNYPEFLGRTNFFGGDEGFSCWMTRADILAGLEYFGFREVKIEFEDLDHLHGPCFCLVGFKPG
jgi:hypothetical protein